MIVTRRGAMGGLVGMGLSTPALAQGTYPSRTIRIIVPRAAGGGTDVLIRQLVPVLSAQLGQTVVVDNRADMTTVVGTEIVARSEPDGYTILAADNTFYFNPAIQKRLPYDTLKDFAGVTMLADSPVVLMAGPKAATKTLPDLIAAAKRDPGGVAYGSGGVGASTHFAGVLFCLKAGIEMTHVPYRSTGPLMSGLLAGDIGVMFNGPRALLSNEQLIGLATTARDPSLPNVKTFGEQGVPGVDVSSIWGIHVPAATPMPIRLRLRDAFAAALNDPSIGPALRDRGVYPIGDTPEAHQARTAEIVEQWVQISRTIDLSK
ncbi:Bug family tripartite tricarboxylate transporter substrate binding protein [Pararoseomonas indoligenes]|uniref:Tripartite tricarboxylate transporter substrate binding protein n=1 Tax=Roseomonas indoligenes TaxID=2820811 RepID=A0A940MX28_9PROT|nr:tripartite tricarboxylate transporter substrate-binding protein [Pararoseomonas indoligenes]MBP0494989.1 tripartite tricarboxylate transporter substrate binding protein [Pararoseomonas indoligenes]